MKDINYLYLQNGKITKYKTKQEHLELLSIFEMEKFNNELEHKKKNFNVKDIIYGTYIGLKEGTYKLLDYSPIYFKYKKIKDL